MENTAEVLRIRVGDLASPPFISPFKITAVSVEGYYDQFALRMPAVVLDPGADPHNEKILTVWQLQTRMAREPELAQRLNKFGIDEPLERISKAQEAGLTPRQFEVLQLAVAGLSKRRIAQILGKSENTIRNQSGAAFKRLGVENRFQAFLEGVKRGLISVYKTALLVEKECQTDRIKVKKLTGRQREVLLERGLGLSKEETAKVLGISISTVKNLTAKIRRKLGVENDLQGVVLLLAEPQE